MEVTLDSIIAMHQNQEYLNINVPNYSHHWPLQTTKQTTPHSANDNLTWSSTMDLLSCLSQTGRTVNNKVKNFE